MNACVTIHILIIKSLKNSEANISDSQNILNIFNPPIALLLTQKIISQKKC